MKNIIFMIVLISIFICPNRGSAEEKKLEMESVSVTEKSSSSDKAYSWTSVPESSKSSVEIFTQEDIQTALPKTVYDVVSLGAGIQLQFQGRKNMNFMEIRGGDNLGIIIDGLYLPDSQAGRILGMLPTEVVESVKIVRDATSLGLGPLTALTSPLGSSVQGFIVITTKRAKKLEAGGSVEYGSHNSKNLQAYYGDIASGFNYRITGTTKGTSGVDGWNNASDSSSVMLSGGYDGQSIKGDFAFFYAKGMTELQRSIPTSKTYDSIWKYDPLSALWIATNFHKSWTDRQISSFSFSYGRVEDDLHTDSYSNPASLKITDQEDNAFNYHFWHTAMTGTNTLKTGVQVIKWDTPTGQMFYEGVKRDETLIGGYAQDEYKIMDNRLTFDSAMRIDRKYIGKGYDKYSSSQVSTGRIEDEWGEPVIGTTIGSSFRVDDIHKLSARLGYSNQETDSFIATVDNKNLDPEVRYKYEAGFSGAYHPAFNFAATFFYYDIKDFKQAVATTGTGNNIVNLYDALDVTRKGLELTASGNLPMGFDYKANYSYIESDMQHSTLAGSNNTIPAGIFALMVGYRSGIIESGMTLKYVSPYDDNFFATDGKYHEIGDYTRIDANISYLFKISGLGAKATLYGRNLFDDNYQTRLGWEDIGRTYGGIVSVTY